MKFLKYCLLHSFTILSLWFLVGCGSSSSGSDRVAPIVTLNGSASIQIPLNSECVELGATAIDNVDGVLNVSIEGSVDTTIPNLYELIYSATDLSGNIGQTTRTIEVLDEPLVNTEISYPQPPTSFFFDGTLINADYWTEEPQILSAGVGFADILGIDVPEITESVALQVGGGLVFRY